MEYITSLGLLALLVIGFVLTASARKTMDVRRPVPATNVTHLTKKIREINFLISATTDGLDAVKLTRLRDELVNNLIDIVDSGTVNHLLSANSSTRTSNVVPLRSLSKDLQLAHTEKNLKT